MQRPIVVALALGLTTGLSAQAEAQIDVSCPQEIINLLGGAGTGPTDCQEWKHGVEGAFLNTRVSITPGQPNRCGFEQRFEGSGQILLVEPREEVCTVGPDRDCPVVIPQIGPNPIMDPDPELRGRRSFLSIPARLNLGIVAFSPNQSPVFEGAIGLRQDLGNGRTQIVWSNDPDPNPLSCTDTGVACDDDDDCPAGDCQPAPGALNFPYLYNTDGDPFNADVALRTGDGLCCDSVADTICQVLGNAEVDPAEPDLGLPRPRPNTPDFRTDVPPFVFEAGRGSAFRMQAGVAAVPASTTGPYIVPNQLYGVCATKRFVACDAVDANGSPQDPDAICQLGICLQPSGTPFGSPFPALCSSGDDCMAQGAPEGTMCQGTGVDSCDLDDVGGRVSEEDLLLGANKGESNPARCNHFGFYVAGNGVAAVGTEAGRSSGCSLLTFYTAETDGFPLSGCQIGNFGSFTRPDQNCDGVEDDTDSDGAPGPDLCPFFTETKPFADENQDGIGDECQCGDFNGDGSITALDIGGQAQCANGVVPCDATRVDSNGDGAATSLDIAGVAQVVNGQVTTADLTCQVNLLTLK